MREPGRQAIHGWVLLGLAAYLLLPWFMQQDGALASAWLHLFEPSEQANGLVQAGAPGRGWLWAGFAGLVVAGLAARLSASRLQGLLLLAATAIGLLGLLGGGFLSPVVEGQPRQPGWGLGGFAACTALLMLFGAALARLGLFRGDVFVSCAVVCCSALLLVFVAWPVGKVLLTAVLADDGRVSPAALAQRILTPRLWSLGCLRGGRCGVAWSTVFLALLTAAGTTLLGTMIALVAARGAQPRLAKAMNGLALLPIITPPFVVGLGLILLFGRAGLVNQFLEYAFGVAPTRWFYGLFGVWLAQLFAFTPIAFMIVRGVLQGISPSLEEAAQTLRASRLRTFATVTLPLLMPGLANAFLVGFIESIADFGNPVIVGGDYAVLSTEIFFAIVGAQLDQGIAAALALVLCGFALTVFFVQRRLLGRTSFVTVSGKGDAGIPMPLPTGVRRLCVGISGPWLAFTLVVYLFAFTGGFVQTWGRDYTVTLSHFTHAFALQWVDGGLHLAGTAWNSLLTTIKLAAIAAPVCAGIGLLISWLLARTRFRGQGVFEFGALLAFAIPGTVLGLAYVLAFNVPPIELTGTGLVIVLCFVSRSLPVGVRAGTASFRQLDRSLDEASLMLRASTAATLRRVVLPLLKPALVTALVYSFVRSMTTVSAVIFLVTAENELATTYIIGRVGNGDYGGALAYCTVLIVLMSIVTALIQRLVGDPRLGRRALPPSIAPAVSTGTRP
jgi:iron(III) transport system permease protein